MILGIGIMNKFPVILQVRSSSKRLPRKALMEVNGKPLIYWQILRVLESDNVSEIVLATSSDQSDDELCNYAFNLPVKIFRGDLLDVLKRFRQVVEKFDFSSFIRLTGDCPLSSPMLISKMSQFAKKQPFDYCTNTMPPSYPDGLDVEIVDSEALFKLDSEVTSSQVREHVTLGFIHSKNKYKIYNFNSDKDLSAYRLTVDYPEDFKFMSELFKRIEGRELTIEIEDIIQVIESNSIKHALGSEYRNLSIRKINEKN